jgi:site-specific recombinase XerD
MAALTFSYRSKLNEANLEARLSFTDKENKRNSIYSRSMIKVEKEFWIEYNEGTAFRDSTKIIKADSYNAKIKALREHTLQQFNQCEASVINKEWLEITIHEFYFPPKVKEPTPTDLVEYYQYYLDEKELTLSESKRSWQKWITVLNKLKKVIKFSKRSFEVSQVDESFTTEWIKYGKAEGYSYHTINKEFSYIKTVCRHAKSKGLKVSSELETLKVNLKTTNTPKIYLSFDELDAINSLQDLPEHLDNAKDWLLISCFSGQRISDFMRFKPTMLRNENNKVFLDVRQKKTGKEVTIPIMPIILKILEKRNGNFPKAISSQRYNDHIKEVAHLAGLTNVIQGGIRKNNRIKLGMYPKWQLITSHAGRRTLATNFYGKIPTTYLKNITGHGTEQMLLAYIGKTSKDTAFDSYDKMIKATN